MLQALRDEIIVKPMYEKRISSIIIPEEAKKFKQYDGRVYGIVVSIGNRYPYKVNIGDKVSFRRHEGKRIDYNGERYLALKEKWIDARLEG